MKQYEIIFITRENLSGKDDPLTKEIEALDGKILNTSALGQKQLAYPIKKEKSGFYTSCLFEIEPEKLTDLNRKLDLKEEILRHLIIVAPKMVTPPMAPKIEKKTLKKEEILPEKIVEAPKIEEKPLKIEKIAPKPAEPKKEAPKKIKEEKKEVEETEEERLKALDKKLDELLKE